MKFSILVVCLNAGEKLKKTIESIQNQTFLDVEIIVKDGGSTDGCLDEIASQVASDKRIKVVIKKDTGIYDAMNQAVQEATGEYVYFLNCGDLFYDQDVLSRMNQGMMSNQGSVDTAVELEESVPAIYYGNIFERVTGQQVTSNPNLDDFGCYRNVPCHQACFYDRRLLLDHPFETKYKVRADYEQFLWCFYTMKYGKRVQLHYMDYLIADYEGGGFSETKENLKRSEREHQEIVRMYMSGKQILKYRMILLLTLAPIRTWIARNEKTAGIYNQIKGAIYHRK